MLSLCYIIIKSFIICNVLKSRKVKGDYEDMLYEKEHLQEISFPLGGIGTGCIGLAEMADCLNGKSLIGLPRVWGMAIAVF